MEKPYISFVVTARNDDYGGHWQDRINAFIKILAYQSERTHLPCELVFVEYNPVKDKKTLREELIIPKNVFFRTRFITVPEEFHKTLPDNDKVKICEFIGKNIGIKRASGEFICGTNPDVLYSDELFDFFAEKKLNKSVFYRINRVDTSIKRFEPSASPETMLGTARKRQTKIMYPDQTVYLSYARWLDDFIHGRSLKMFLRCPVLNFLRKIDLEKIHENAAGDFLLSHKDNWDKAGGYDERTVGSGVLDSYILYVMFCAGIRQILLPYPIFHLHHHHKGVKYLASHAQLRADAQEMLATRTPYKKRNAGWGFTDVQFTEREASRLTAI